MKRKLERVLLIEDEESHAELVRRAFEDYQSTAKLSVASTIRDARRMLADSPPDVVFIDMILPDGNGVELLAEIGPDTPYPAVIITSHGNESVAVGALKAGALDYIVKSEMLFTAMPQIADRVFREWTHIVEKKKAERALGKSEEQYRAIVAAIPDTIFRVQSDGILTYFKDVPGGQFVRDPNAIIGQPVSKIFPESTAAGLLRIMRKVLEDGVPGLFKFDLPRGDGFGHYEARIARINDSEILGLARDLTEEKKLEKQIQQLQKLEALGRLAGGVAHDFNNLLTGILGYVEFLEEDLKDNERLLADLLEIKGAARRAAELTGRLLAFSRKQLIEPRELDLNDLIGGLSMLLKKLVGEDVELSIIPGHSLGTVKADPGQIEQVLINLAINSRDAISGPGKIIIETENVVIDAAYAKEHPWSREGRYVLINVSDNGCGMPAEILDQIFEPFFTTKEIGKGTGLGLATVYGIVNQHDGMIHVYSELDMGTTFKIYLPIIERKAKAVGVFIPEKVRGGNETILLAEDEEVVRKSTLRVLERAGYTVIAAEDGEDAMLQFKKHADEIDLAIIDVIMPRKSGADVLREILAIKPSQKTILCSGYSAEKLNEVLSFLPDANMISKPYNPEGLLLLVRRALSGAKPLPFEGGESSFLPVP